MPVNEEYEETHPPEPTRIERVVNVFRPEPDPRTSISWQAIGLFVIVAAVLGLTPMPYGAVGFAALILLAVERASIRKR